MAASAMRPLQNLFEASRLDLLEQRRSRRQLRRILKGYIERPITDRRLINNEWRNIRPWTNRLSRMIKRNKRPHVIPTALDRIPVFDKAWKIDHSAIQS